MKNRIFFLLILALIPFAVTEGQKAGKKITITGYVTDGTQASISNAIVTIDGLETTHVTNGKGYYKIKVKPEVKKIGILTLTSGILEQEINGRTRINFQFEGTVPDQVSTVPDPGEDVVDIGYGKVKRRNMTSTVSKIDGTNPKYASYKNIYDMIRGEVPGVQVSGNSIKIQGASSLTLSTEPLFVVDGVTVNTIDGIQPYMVQSIQVLKGSSASIYGSRGANGVIVINLVTGNK
ncbi:MAG: TonB-dependent receptor plug domain-containing protein [Bacteroidales bacterium]|jgi:TonB-dependent SusC/RagA subfamily outer membrane receptor|nr:TonB-dependent receptor plug domain-containing protein [Bacteroidales bacterium]